MKDVFGWAALGVSLAANVPYIVAILRGKARPERMSWSLWTLLGAIYFGTAVMEEGATIFSFGELAGYSIILALSLRYGVGGNSRQDLYALGVAMVALVLLVTTQNSLVSLLLALFIDTIGAVLTLNKLRSDPTSESRLFWGLSATASLLAVLSLRTLSFETLAFPVYLFGLSVVIVLMTRGTRAVLHSSARSS